MYSKLLVLIQTQFWRHLVKHGTSEVWTENIGFFLQYQEVDSRIKKKIGNIGKHIGLFTD